jgi:hypothetical protein
MDKQFTRKRPFGVIAIIALQLLGIIVLVFEVFGLQLGPLAIITPTWFRDDKLILGARGAFDPPTFAIGAVLLLWELLIVYGLWRLQRWAWFLLMIQLGVGMGLYLWLYFNGTALYISMLLNVIVVFYLNQREVQQAFARKRDLKEASP